MQPFRKFVLSGFFSAIVASGVLPLLAGCAWQQADNAQSPAPLPVTAVKQPEAQQPETDAGLNATLWVQTSAEARACALQTYRLAALQLNEALKDKQWTASLEQAAMPAAEYSRLAPAIVLDIDETVLDNSPFQARLVKKGESYNKQAWQEWVAQADAQAIPGAVEFVQAARAKNIKVFFVSNRTRDEEAATLENLHRVGLLPQKTGYSVLSRFEREDWQSDKTTRRRFLAEKYRILFLLGDDFNDFVTGTKTSPATRRGLMQRHQKMWGRQWFVLPNPLYGSWEGAILKFDYDLSDKARNEAKLSALKTREIPKHN